MTIDDSGYHSAPQGDVPAPQFPAEGPAAEEGQRPSVPPVGPNPPVPPAPQTPPPAPQRNNSGWVPVLIIVLIILLLVCALTIIAVVVFALVASGQYTINWNSMLLPLAVGA